MQQVTRDAKEKRKYSKIRLMFTDEARFGLMGQTCSCWAPPGFRPQIPVGLSRQFVYAYCAVSPVDGKTVGLILPYANTESMSVFLSEVSCSFPDEYVILWMDQAGWHRSRDLKVPENIRIEFLPPYSPQLNPTEHVWDEIREKYFKNRYFAGLEQVEEQLFESLKNLQQDEEKVRSLTGFEWILNLK